jgi:predicted PurR-regulated permease PerM
MSVQPVPVNKKFPKWLKIICIVVVVFVLLIVGVFLISHEATENAVKISNKLVTDIQTDNASAAYSLTTAGFKQTSSQAELTQIIGQISPALQGTYKTTSRSIVKIKNQPDEAIIVYTVKTDAGNKYIRVVLQDNTMWQVLNFRSSNTPLSGSSDD